VKRNQVRRLEALGSQSLSSQSPDQQFLPPTEAQPRRPAGDHARLSPAIPIFDNEHGEQH